MQLKFLTGLFTLALAITAFTAPVPEPIPALAILEARSASPTFTFSGDLTDIKIPPAGTDKKSIAKNKKAEARQAVKVTKQKAASARVSIVLAAASSSLGLSGSLAVDVSNDFHPSPSDHESHATFSFKAAVCKGTCVGHAYNPVSTVSPGKGQPGKIFDAEHATIFGAADI